MICAQPIEEIPGPILDKGPGVDGDDPEVVSCVSGLLVSGSPVVVIVSGSSVVFNVDTVSWQVEIGNEVLSFAIEDDLDGLLVDVWDTVFIQCLGHTPFSFGSESPGPLSGKFAFKVFRFVLVHGIR